MAYTNLNLGSRNDEVKRLQQELINQGYDVGSSGADGIYGAKTQAAVKAYQRANNLTVDGIAGNTCGGAEALHDNQCSGGFIHRKNPLSLADARRVGGMTAGDKQV